MNILAILYFRNGKKMIHYDIEKPNELLSYLQTFV